MFGKRAFFSFLLAWAPVNEAALAVFAQVLSISLNQISQYIIFSEWEDDHRCGEKVPFPAFCFLERL